MALFFLRYLLIAGSVAAAIYAFILARSEQLFHLNTAESVPAAVKLVPYHSAYLTRLAAWQPDERDSLLRRAVALNPWDFQSWIQLGLITELQQGNASEAERNYLRAAEVNRMFMPKWTLANFYFRRQRTSDFFTWANRALQITPYASDPIFGQMWMVGRDPARIAAAIPDRARVLLQYAWYLSNNRQFSEIPPIVQRLIRRVGKGDPALWGRDDLLASIEDRLLGEDDARDALAIWGHLASGGWIQHTVPDPKHPLTNGDFRVPFYRHGFDWAPVDAAGTRTEQYGGAVHVSLSGDQPEHCVLLRQFVPLARGGAYTLEWRAVTQINGLAWHVEKQSADLLATGARWQFQAPASEVAVLSLEYDRPPGRVRESGTVTLESVTLLPRDGR